jgi:hypothetical protein
MTTTLRITSWALVATATVLGPEATAGQIGASDKPRRQAYQMLAGSIPSGVKEVQPDKCGLHVIASAMHHRRELTSGQKTALSILQTRPSLDTSIVSGMFRVHFDTTGLNTPALLDSSHARIPGTAFAYADSVASVAVFVYNYETSVLGFPPPPSDGSLGGGPEYDIYIENLGVGLYGETIPDLDVADGGTCSTFIEIHNDFSFVNPPGNRGLPGMRVTIAHEFIHAIQIGNYGFWWTDIWFHETTSTWIEDVVFHGVNDYLNYLFGNESQFQTPDLPLNTNAFIFYSRCIWCKYLTKRFGGATVLHIWEAAHSMMPLAAIDNTLQTRYNSSLSAALAEWTLWNYFTGPRADTAKYYSESPLFPIIAETYYALNVSSQQVSESLPCLSGTYFGFISGIDTVTVALANVNTSCPTGSANFSPFTLTVSKTKQDNTYRAIAGNLFLKLDVSDPSQWVTWDIERNAVGSPSVTEGTAYPSPFLLNQQSAVYIPANATEGDLTIYSSGMDLVYHAHQQLTSRAGQTVFVWDGRTSGGNAANTGIYVFVLGLGNRTVTGKIALVRK